jgi:hypothetical protein
MSSSITTLVPAGQQHDREDADMGEAAGVTNDSSLTNGHVVESPVPPGNRENSNNAVAIEVAAVDEDAMDTTPDHIVELVLQDGLDAPHDATNTPTSPLRLEALVGEPGIDGMVAPDAPADDVVS